MKKILPIFASIFTFFLALSPSKVYAISANLTAVPVAGSYDVGDTFNVAIKVNTAGQAINTVKAYLTFDSAFIKVTNISTTGSFIAGIWPENVYDNTAGSIHLVGGIIPPGFTGADGLLATVTFQALKAGVARVNFSSDSKIRLLSDSSDVFSLSLSNPGVYTISGGTGDGTSGSSGTSTEYHLACVDSSCVLVAGAGANLNGCTTSGASCSATAIDTGSFGPTALLGLAGLIFISLGMLSQLVDLSSLVKKSRARSFENSFYK